MGAAWTHICCSPASIDFKCVEWSDITMDQPMLLLRPTKIGGGFVKEDVLAYVDELNSKIVALENELKEAQESVAGPGLDQQQAQKYENEIKGLRSDLGAANAALRKAKEDLENQAKNAGGDTGKLTAENQRLTAENEKLKQDAAKFQDVKAALEKEIEKLKADLAAKPAEAIPAVPNVDDAIMKQEIAKRDSQLAEKAAELKAKSEQLMTKDAAIAEKNQKIASLEKDVKKLQDEVDDLKTAGDSSMSPSFDMGALFAEAQMTAKKLTLEARNAAEKTTREAKEQAESIVSEANAQAERKIADAESVIEATIMEANAKADATIDDANAKAKTTNEMTGTVRQMLNNEIDGVTKKLTEITNLINQLTDQAAKRLDEAQSVAMEARKTVGDVPDPKADAFEKPKAAMADELKVKLHQAPEQKPVKHDAPKQEPTANTAPNKGAKKPANFGFDFDDLTKAVEEAAKNGGNDNDSWTL